MDASTEKMPKKSFFQYFMDALKKYADFKGRARRTEYFSFAIISNIIVFLASRILTFVCAIVFGEDSVISSVIEDLPALAFIVPIFAVAWRRMHDCGKSGLYCLIPIYNIILVFRNGVSGENQYGPDPKNSVMN